MNALRSAFSPSCEQLVGGATPAIIGEIAFSAPPANVNVSTEGTIDWIRTDFQFGTNQWASHRDSTVATIHRKISGGPLGLSLVDTLRAMHGGTAQQTNASAIAGTTFTTTASDDALGTAGNSTTYATFFTVANAAPNNYGFEFAVPVRTSAQTVRIYFSQSGSTVTVDARGSLSGNAVTATNTVGAIQLNGLATFVIGAGSPEMVNVRIRVTTNTAGDSSICLAAITVAA